MGKYELEDDTYRDRIPPPKLSDTVILLSKDGVAPEHTENIRIEADTAMEDNDELLFCVDHPIHHTRILSSWANIRRLDLLSRKK